MTAGNDGTPENDDPFGYLYRSEGGEPQPDPAAMQQPGMPRTSHHQVTRVGERRPQPPQQQAPAGYGYPQQQAPAGYGYPQQQQQAPSGGYGYPQQQGHPQQQTQQQGYPQQQYAPDPQQPPGQPPTGRRSAGGGGAGGRQGGDTPNRKGLLIAAVAIVAAVAIGIAFAMTNGSGSGDKQADKPSSPPVTSAQPTQTTPSAAPPAPFDSKMVDASTLPLAGGAQQSTQWPGAAAANGQYVDHMTQVGAGVTWTVTVPKDDTYTFFTYYGNAGADATLTLTVNGKPRTDPVKLLNYGHYTDWQKAWNNHTYSYVDLKKGSNTLQLSCQPGNQCGVNLDQLRLKEGQVKS